MLIVVTGGTGYIGREFIKKYSKSFDIIALVRNSSLISKIENLDCKIKRFTNLNEIDIIFNELKPIGVVHFASNIIVEHKSDEISSLIKSNIEYGVYLLESCKSNHVKWFLNTGTFWQNYQNEEYNPVNFYAATKEAFENIAKYYTQTSNLIFTTIKLNDTFGPNDSRNKIFNIWKKIAESGEILDMSQGEQIIDISYIEDIISAYEVLITHLNSDNSQIFKDRTFAVKSESRVSLKKLSKIFEKVTTSNLNIVWGNRKYREREVMIPWEKGECVPGWKPKYSLFEAIKKTIGEI